MSALTTARDLKTHFLGLANPTRLAILSLLAHREMPVSEIADRLRLSQPLLSWHLRIMRKAGLIVTRRVGREVQCRLDREAILGYQKRFNQFIGPPQKGTDGRQDDQTRELRGTLVNEEIANAI
ncbi:MAG TPA: metalloregulator ArsR/SmtB family transcription factor [Candidatus Dormibacteraeota bacterium]|jgi:DNA-binding transcriptional ArsR family regulator|nr:metalloregulator ArsR/SmtB family transcription factor [Candidatus Dormibacteraeota bacterium]